MAPSWDEREDKEGSGVQCAWVHSVKKIKARTAGIKDRKGQGPLPVSVSLRRTMGAPASVY